MAEVMGEDNEIVKMSPCRKIATRSRGGTGSWHDAQGCRGAQAARRRRLEGHPGFERSHDPARATGRPGLAPDSPDFEQQVDEPQRQAYGKIANARFAVYGSSVYPDATFTLAPGLWRGQGIQRRRQKIPWATTLGGTYEHAAAHNNKEPFELPTIWNERKSQLNLSTPFNFVSTADIIGGNSGSPVVNRQGELVGIIFDGNIQSLAWTTSTPGRYRCSPTPEIRCCRQK